MTIAARLKSPRADVRRQTPRMFLRAHGVLKHPTTKYRDVLAELRRDFGPQPSPPPKQQRHRIEQRQFVQTGERATA